MEKLIILRFEKENEIKVLEDGQLLGSFTPRATLKLLRKRLGLLDFEDAFEGV